jgi:hypothetical protein
MRKLSASACEVTRPSRSCICVAMVEIVSPYPANPLKEWNDLAVQGEALGQLSIEGRS